MDREQYALLLGVFDLLLEELAQGPLAHERGIDDFPGLQRHFRLEHGRLAVLADELDPRIGRRGHRHGLFVGPEIPALHMGDMRLGVRTPGSHLMRMLPGMGLHGKRRAAIGVAFAQHRVDGTAFDFVVASLDVLLFVVFRIFRILWKLVALALQFLDGPLYLGKRGTDVRKLDDIGLRRLGHLAQFRQRIRLLLLRRQVSGNTARIRPANEISRNSTDTPAALLKALMIGRNE